MDNKLASANKVISGTWGEVWLGGDYVGECYGMSAKVAYNKEDVALCGRMVTDKKITSIACTGKLSLYKVNSRMANKITKNAMNGIDSRFTPSRARSFGQEISRSPGTSTNRKLPSPRRTTSVLTMSRGATPRAEAASSREPTRPCRVISCSSPEAARASCARCSLMGPR